MDLLSWLITGILGGVVLYIVYWLITIKSNHWEKIGVPCKKSAPLIGVVWEIIFMKKGFGEIIADLYKQYDGHKFFGYYQFLTPAIMIRDPELINKVLIKDFSYFEDRGPPATGVKDLFLMGVSNLTGDEWRTVRHKITPTFTSGKLKMMFDPIKECSDGVVHHVESKIGEDFEARDLMLRYVLNVIGSVAFGIKLDILNENDKQSQEFFKYSSSFFKPSMLLLIKFMITTSKPKIRELLKFKLMDNNVETYFKQLTHDVIKCREKNSAGRNDFLQLMLDLQKKERSGESCPNVASGHKGELVDAEDKELMEQLKNTPLGSIEQSKSEIFTEEFISSQTFLFISGGSETTATVLSFILYELAANQEVQKKVQDELNNVLNSQEFNYQDVRKLTYMEQCINETLRLHPILAGLMRMCTRDYKIPGTEVVIPKGSYVNIPAGALHMDPQYFPDPDKFNPDRFEDMDAIPKGVYFSFGGGPRICIAMRLAMLEMKVVLASILLNFTVVLSEKTKLPLTTIKTSVVPRVEGGIWLKFKRREA